MSTIPEQAPRRRLARAGRKRIALLAALLGIVCLGVRIWIDTHRGVSITFVNRTLIPLKDVHVVLDGGGRIEAGQLPAWGVLSESIPISGQEWRMTHVNLTPRDAQIGTHNRYGIDFGLYDPDHVLLELIHVEGATDPRDVEFRVRYTSRPTVKNFLTHLWSGRMPFASDSFVDKFLLPRGKADPGKAPGKGK